MGDLKIGNWSYFLVYVERGHRMSKMNEEVLSVFSYFFPKFRPLYTIFCSYSISIKNFLRIQNIMFYFSV